MQVSTICTTYQQVLEYLDLAKSVYKVIKQKYDTDIGIVLIEGRISYQVILKIYEST